VSGLTGDEPDLQVGDSGEGVVLLQVRLYGLGIYRNVPDGTFDMTTENAVRELQSTLGLDNDGEVTRATWEAIVELEMRYSIQYQYMSPYDALSQINYDLQHPEQAAGGGAGQGQLSEDGQWQWDGYSWQAAADGAGQHAGSGSHDSYAGQLSEDGQWQWDGTAWQTASADSQVGQLSDDGQWRWDGRQWSAA
jgi:peptidoglycan hydrolase-like protein with peptidoglycan-binding domain